MRRIKKIGLAIFTLTSATAAAGTPAQAQSVYGADLSADGKSYAILRQLQDQRVVAIYDADDAQKPPVAVGLGDLPTYEFAWGGDHQVLVRVSADRAGLRTTEGLQTVTTSRWMAIDKDTGDIETLFGDQVGNDYNYYIGAAGDLISSLPEDPQQALFSRVTVDIKPGGPSRLQSGDDKLVNALREVSLQNRRERRVELGNEKTIDWVVTERGAPVARIDERNGGGVNVFTRPDAKGAFRQVAAIDYDESPYSKVAFYGASDRAGAIQALVTGDDGFEKLVEFDLATGAFGDVIFAPSAGRIDAVIMDYRRGFALAAAGGGVVRHLHSADQADAEKLQKAVPGSTMLILSRSVSGERLIAKALYADRGAEYFFYDAPGKRLELIAREQ